MQPRRRFNVPLPRGRSLPVGERTVVMGIVNVTPDSFSDGGVLFDPAAAVEAGVHMAEQGAGIIDVGGESTRPGATSIDAREEARRVVPVVKALAARVAAPISVDTYRAAVADAALDSGASIVNDISGLRYEPELADVVARRGAAVILMHMRGRSLNMYQHASYGNVVAEVLDELRESVAFAAGAGIPRARMLIDPGLGFAKEAAHSFELLARLAEFAELGCPIVAGPSRKSFLTRPLGASLPPSARDWASAAAVTAAVLAGAHVVRVHAVAEMLQVTRVADEIRRYHRVD